MTDVQVSPAKGHSLFAHLSVCFVPWKSELAVDQKG